MCSCTILHIYPVTQRKIMLRRFLTTKITRTRLRDFLAHHATSERVLDVGSSANTLADLFPNTFRGDIRHIPEVDVQYDAHSLPILSESVATILCTEVLEHCHTPQQVIHEFYRVLQPNGKLILTTRFVFPLHDTPHDYFRFTRYGLQHLCKQFAVIEIIEETGTVETVAVLLQRLIYQVNWKLPGMKVILGLLARLIMPLQHTITHEYGEIDKKTSEKAILSSGYYLIATKANIED